MLLLNTLQQYSDNSLVRTISPINPDMVKAMSVILSIVATPKDVATSTVTIGDNEVQFESRLNEHIATVNAGLVNYFKNRIKDSTFREKLKILAKYSRVS
jgi:phosphoribosylcarboxyaminoimidazole (NCAIR) mutase